MKLQTKLFNVSLVLAAVLLLVPATMAFAASPPQPTYDTAIVDGDYSEWDLANDFFADMYRAANTNKKVESKLYLRYDCSTETMYALVLSVNDIPVLVEATNAFVKIDGSKVVDGNDASFAWVGQGFDGDNNHARGFEASFPLASQTDYSLNVHVNVYDDGASQTSAVADRDIDLTIYCPPDPTAVELASFDAAVQGRTIQLTWVTASEIDNLGFNIHRAESPDGIRIKMNGVLLPAQAPGSPAGGSYEFVDEAVVPGITYYYWLEAADTHGGSTFHGPVSKTVRNFARLLPVRARLAISPPIIGSK